jgi:hypothetical protein
VTRRVAVVATTFTLPLAAAAPAGARTDPNGYARACRQAGRVVAARSALPPLPLDTVLSATRVAVVARVDAVLYQGHKPPAPKRPAGFAGPIPPEGCQVVRLDVQRALLGSPPTTLVVVKPEAPYRLRASARVHPGTFLVDGATPYPAILGNYGPDPYSPQDVAAALAGGAEIGTGRV